MIGDLFQLGNFKLHSGAESAWKIECDALTLAEWATLAKMLTEVLPPFGVVKGVPRGGLVLAETLSWHSVPGGLSLLVDDVLTTGKSMEEMRLRLYRPDAVIGAVIFARGPCPTWITPLFQMPGVRS